MLTLSNPRSEATIEDYPIGSNRRGNVHFKTEQGTRGKQKEQERMLRTTTGKPKPSTFYSKIRVVDGDDGKTHLIAQPYGYNFVYLIPATMKTTKAFHPPSNHSTEEEDAMYNQITELLKAS